MAVRLGLRSYAADGTYDGERSIEQAAIEDNMGSFVLGPLAVNALELLTLAQPSPLTAAGASRTRSRA